MMNKHTPGPWSMNGPTLVGNGYNIGSVNSHRTSEGEANARLIAAAPDLLAALEICTAAIEHRFGKCHELSKARAAIAKATGSAS